MAPASLATGSLPFLAVDLPPPSGWRQRRSGLEPPFAVAARSCNASDSSRLACAVPDRSRDRTLEGTGRHRQAPVPTLATPTRSALRRHRARSQIGPITPPRRLASAAGRSAPRPRARGACNVPRIRAAGRPPPARRALTVAGGEKRLPHQHPRRDDLCPAAARAIAAPDDGWPSRGTSRARRWLRHSRAGRTAPIPGGGRRASCRGLTAC